MWWHERAVKERRKYFLLRAIIIVGGVSIPVLSAFNLKLAFASYLPAGRLGKAWQTTGKPGAKSIAPPNA